MGALRHLKRKNKRPHRAAPQLVPEELLGLRFTCIKCGTVSAMPWLEKLPEPVIPEFVADRGAYRTPAVMPVSCPAPGCDAVIEAKVPPGEIECNWVLYGDEAGRSIPQPAPAFSTEPLHFFCITLVGLHATKHGEVQAAIRQMKREAKPGQDPDSWPHHFSEIWGESADEGGHALRGKPEKIKYAEKWAKCIRVARPHLVTFTFCGSLVDDDPVARKARIKAQKEGLFAFCLAASLRWLRAHKKGIRWVFDNVADTSGGRTPTEGWAKEVFLGLQYTRLFQWLAAGAAVVEPAFAKPGSHFLSEIADFLSFWTAREFERHVRGLSSECPTKLAGEGHFQFVMEGGDAEHAMSLADLLPKRA